ncbi:hypothetical protein Bca4012_075966 [Brassica carinata]
MTDMADPYYAEMKQQKRDADWLFPCMYANCCIPKKCTCGGTITVETDERGRNYYVCKVFEVRMVVTLINNDSLHIRRACHDAIEEEVDVMKSKFREEVSLHRRLQFEVEEMRKDIQELKNLLMRVREYNTLFLKSGLLEIHQQETLVMMYRDGLREEIRAELGVHGDESDESGNRSKEKSRSGECETSGDTDFSTTKSDESGNRTKKKARTGEDFLQNLDGEEEDPGQADDNDAFNDSDGSVPQGVGGSDEESDSKVDLEDYKEYLEEHHRSESESSRESK